jgi:hypothetical protein
MRAHLGSLYRLVIGTAELAARPSFSIQPCHRSLAKAIGSMPTSLDRVALKLNRVDHYGIIAPRRGPPF